MITTNVPNDTFIGSDGTDDGRNVSVTADKLLAQLTVSAETVAAGDTFTVSLLPSFNTFFFDDAFTSISFTSTPGTVQIGETIGPRVVRGEDKGVRTEWHCRVLNLSHVHSLRNSLRRTALGFCISL